MDQSHSDWRQIWLIWGIGLLAAAQFGKISLAFDLVREVYPRPDPELALIVSGVGVVGILFGAVAGIGVGRLGARRVLLMAMALGGALSVVQSMLPGFWTLIGLRVIEGFAHLAIVVACPVLMAAAAAPKHRALAMALWATFFGVSFALTAQIIPVLDALGGLSAVFLAHGLALWALVPLVWLWVSKARGAPRPWHGLIRAHLAIYSDPARVAPALTFFWHTLSFVALLTFLPEQLAGPLPQPIIAGVLPLAALLGTFGAGALARYIPPLRICMVSFGFSVVLMALLPLVGGAAQIALAMVLLISLGVVPGGAFAAIPALNADPGDQAEANGALAQLGNIGTTFGTPIYALALVTGGMGGMSLVTVAVCVLGILSVLWMSARLR